MVQNLRKNITVQLSIIHDQNLLFQLITINLCAVCISIFYLIRLGYHQILTGFRLVHKAVSSSYHTSDGFICPGNCSSNTHRKLNPGISRHSSQVDLIMDFLQSSGKFHFCYSGKHQKKLIPAIADQNIILTDMLAYGFCNNSQCHIPGIMSICVVIKLKIVQIDHGNSSRSHLGLQFFFIITSVVCLRKNILIQSLVISGKAADQALMIFLVDQAAFVHFLQKLHYIRITVNFQIFSHDLINVISNKFQLAQLCLP